MNLKLFAVPAVFAFTLLGTGCASTAVRAIPGVTQARLDSRSDMGTIDGSSGPRMLNKLHTARETDAPAEGVF